MRMLIPTIFLIMLSACGGGGGSEASAPSAGTDVFGCTDSLATNYNWLATLDDHSCIYGSGSNGNPAYYGFSSSGMEIDNNNSAPSSVGNIVMSNGFYFEITNGITREVAAAVFEPTCPVNSSIHYSAILVTDTAAANAVTIHVNTFANTVGIKSHSFRDFSNQRYDHEVVTDLAMSCSNGKIVVSNGIEIYSNGKMLVMKSGVNLFVGVAQSSLAITTPSALNFGYLSYNHVSQGNCSFGGCSSPNGAGATSNGNGTLNTAGGISNGVLNSWFGGSTPTLYIYSNAQSTDSSHAIVRQSLALNAPRMTALVADLNNQYLFIGTITNPNNCSPEIGDALITFCTGAIGLTIGIEQ